MTKAEKERFNYMYKRVLYYETTIQKLAELQLLDHQRINALTNAINVLIKDRQKTKVAKVVQMKPNR